MEPQSQHEAGRDWLFLRFYDFRPDGLIQFNLVTLTRNSAVESWKQQISQSLLFPLRQNELLNALAQAGFKEITCYGGLNGSVFEAASSANLVFTARRS